MIFDTDVLIWASRENSNASKIINKTEKLHVSIYTYMELLQKATDKRQLYGIKELLNKLSFVTLPLTENIGHRALIYLEEYTLSNGLDAGDAIIAATAMEYNLPLCSGNKKHFKIFKDLDFKPFNP